VLIGTVWMLTNPEESTPYPPGVGSADMLLGVAVEEAVTDEVKVTEPERVMDADELLVLEEVGEGVLEAVCDGVAVSELVKVTVEVPDGDRELVGVLDGLVPRPTRIEQVVLAAN
jgi:hypothetical protein